MRILMITGVCGVGKSTITQELSKCLTLSWGDYADLMLEVLQETNKDKIQFLDWKKRRAVYNQVEYLISTRFSRQNLDGRIHLLENHLTIIQSGVIVSFPVADYEKYNLIGLINIEASSRSILRRRLKDFARKRVSDTLELIEKQQKINSKEAKKITEYLKIPLLNVVNNDGLIPVTEVEQWIRKVIYQENKLEHPDKL